MAKVAKNKKLIRAPDDLVSKLDEVANRQGKSFYRYVTEIFEQAIRSDEMKRSLKEIIDQYELLEAHKEAGSIFAPSDVLDFLVEKVYLRDAETLKQMWYQTGKWYGIYLNGKFNDALEAFTRLLKDGLWGMNQVDVKNDGETVELRCISTSLPQERTVLFQHFIEGAMHSLGYRTEAQNSFRGIISLKFIRASIQSIGRV